MPLRALSQRHAVSRKWNVWTLMALVLVTSNFWLPLSNAASLPRRDLQRRASIANGLDLRILPIGDSITYGAPDEPYNSYRASLYDKLTNGGNKVDYVGDNASGTLADKQHEGHRGELINRISSSSAGGIYAAANLVLLHAGTNDMKEGTNVLGAPTRLKALINYIFQHSEDAVVLVAQIIPCTLNGVQARIDAFNDELPDLVDSFVKAGKKVALVAMNEALDGSGLQDKLHPTEGGYEKMAVAWYDAIKAVDEEHDDWFTEAGEAQDPPDSTEVSGCQSTPSWYNVGEIAQGAKAAYTDGDFKPAWKKIGVIAEGACPRARLHLMDLDGDGLKDYACVDASNGSVTVHRSKPDSNGGRTTYWEEYGMIATGATGRKGSGVRFADLNGDGRDDYIWVDSRNGAVSAWINQGKRNGNWLWQGLGVIASGVGATTTNVQLADINGDGRADFLIVDQDTGAVTAWLNTGADLIPDWHKLGVIATGGSASEGDTVFLGDFTGEGRADYLIVGESGKVTGLVNRLTETSLIPRWLSKITVAEGPDGVEQEEVRLADMTGDGKVDFMQVSKKTGQITLWENIGTGGKYQIGEGVFLCDLNGDGAKDYFWVDHEGKGWGYLNTGKGTDQWYGLGQTAMGVGYDREHIRMAVLTKSGRSDYIVVGPENGLTLWWQNLGEDYDYNWKERGVAATGPRNTIETKFGWTYKSKNVRFADLDGDGLDDFLYVNDQGAVVYWKNLGTDEISWGPATLVADGVGVLAQDVQFADTNGDGLLDYLVVGRVTGMTRSWHNLGFRSDGSIRWNTPLSFADGTGSAGFAVRIAEMTSDTRADFVSIDPDTGRLNLWKNRCLPSGSNDEDSDDHSNDSEPWTDRTEWEWCHLSPNTGLSPEQKTYIWGSDGAGLGVGQWLDEKLTSDGNEVDWLKEIRNAQKSVLPNDYLYRLDCTSLGSQCDYTQLPNCSEWEPGFQIPISIEG
ncbi:hypothetical protein EDB81DRAFT_683957 [Dactylonectria macrodidyma]|uniref:SGNH hydrolase-type esterase domain-containing protein n=1 Tax=Dactylonectria macrodidyma TaxID=307937 RepID=A0A9P9JK74_9HYPO|nr:hypothetical protein EDB81DRAFT_683957 [Dactylonectria macrodidyma]